MSQYENNLQELLKSSNLFSHLSGRETLLNIQRCLGVTVWLFWFSFCVAWNRIEWNRIVEWVKKKYTTIQNKSVSTKTYTSENTQNVVLFFGFFFFCFFCCMKGSTEGPIFKVTDIFPHLHGDQYIIFIDITVVGVKATEANVLFSFNCRSK